MKSRTACLLLLGFLLSTCSEKNETSGEIYKKGKPTSRLALMPDQGKMHCNVVLIRPDRSRDVFALTIPETIGSREGLLLNFPETDIKWNGPDKTGTVTTRWVKNSILSYTLAIIPYEDYVDVEMTISNLSDRDWHDVWSFNCLSPTKADSYKDSTLHRTFMVGRDGPMALSTTVGNDGPNPNIGIYFQHGIDAPEDYPFINEFGAINPERSHGEYIVTMSESGRSYMAATSPKTLYLFHNLDFTCIHAAPNFGDIDAGEESTLVSRFYFANGDLGAFLDRYGTEVELER